VAGRNAQVFGNVPLMLRRSIGWNWPMLLKNSMAIFDLSAG
jgi:hypothetical protein